jgi:hypothetical protein
MDSHRAPAAGRRTDTAPARAAAVASSRLCVPGPAVVSRTAQLGSRPSRSLPLTGAMTDGKKQWNGCVLRDGPRRGEVLRYTEYPDLERCDFQEIEK